MYQSESKFSVDSINKQYIMRIQGISGRIDGINTERRQADQGYNEDYEDLISEASDNNEDFARNKDGDRLFNLTGEEDPGGTAENAIIVNEKDEHKEHMHELISGSELEGSDIEQESGEVKEVVDVSDIEEDVGKSDLSGVVEESRLSADNEPEEVSDTNNENSRETNYLTLSKSRGFDISDDDIENLEELESDNNKEFSTNTENELANISKNELVKEGLNGDEKPAKSKISALEKNETGELRKYPIILRIYDTEFLLIPFEGESDQDLSHLVALYDDNEVLKLSIEEFFNSIRTNEDICECFKLEDNQELVFNAPDLGELCIVEDNLYARDIIIEDFVSAFYSLVRYTKDESLIPSQMSLVLSSQTRFISGFNRISNIIRSNCGFESIKKIDNATASRGTKHFFNYEESEDNIMKKKAKND